MTKDEINRKLGEDVMGWVIKSTFYNYPREGLIEEYHESNRLGIPIINVSRWNPRENIEQAMEILGKFDNWTMNRVTFSSKINCDIIIQETLICKGIGKTPQEAICNAALSTIKKGVDDGEHDLY